MDFAACFEKHKSILMEGSLSERLKREYHISFDENVVMAGLVYSEDGRRALRELWRGYADTALKYGLPFIADTPTRRVNRERVEASRFNLSIVKDNVDFLRELQRSYPSEMYVGGLLGCRGDAYTGKGCLDVEASRSFHRWEASLFAQAGVDYLYCALIPSVKEAAGMALALSEFEIPYIISFTIQSNGRLIDGTGISDAIKYIDGITTAPPICYMSNCVHPKILYEALSQPFNRNETVRRRFTGLQANTSALPYSELDNCADLKTSDPKELAEDMLKLRELLPLKLFGGCCGTDFRHMEEIAKRICCPC